MNGRGKYSKPTPSSIEEIDNESVPFLFLITMTKRCFGGRVFASQVTIRT